LIADFVVYLGLLIRPRKAIAAENFFLRRQLALYQERNVGPRRIDVRDAHLRWPYSQGYSTGAMRSLWHCGSTEDVDSLASSRISASLALEIKTGTPSDSC
jgi:hypothetical protein